MDSANFTQLLSRLDSLAAKIGATGTQIWQIVFRQQLIEGWVEIGVSLLCFIVLAVGSFFLITRWEEIDEPLNFLAVIGLLLPLICFIGFGLDGLQYLLNPQYFALQDFFHLIPK